MYNFKTMGKYNVLIVVYNFLEKFNSAFLWQIQ